MPANVAVLTAENQKLRVENRELTERANGLAAQTDKLTTENRELVTRLEAAAEEIAKYRARFFGRSSEKLSLEEQQQMRLFDEADQAAAEPQEQEAQTEPTATEVPAHTRRKPKRRPLPESLPREEVVVDISEADKHCKCGHQLVRIGEETCERLDVIPPRIKVIRTVRPKYACHHCEGSGDEQRPAVRVAPAPPTLIPKGIATPGLLAFIATAKFCDALPLYRQQRQFARIDVDLPRSTMADWMLAAGAASRPVLEAMQRKLRSGPLLQVDETSVQVMGEQGRADTTSSYMWVARGGPPGEPVLIYHYAPSRGAPVAAQVIGDFQGFVHTDGYEAYDRVCARPGITHVGCWSHARRRFTDAKKATGKSKKAGAADQALAFIAKLYAAESLRQSTDGLDAFNDTRRAQVEPVLQRLRSWLERKADQVLPRSALGQAVSYTLQQWSKLICYLDSPELTPDTNAVERAIRPFVIGRKNWLFSGSPRGAAASATLYSLIETAKANRREPYLYLRGLFEKLPLAQTPQDYDALIPRPLGR